MYAIAANNRIFIEDLNRDPEHFRESYNRTEKRYTLLRERVRGEIGNLPRNIPGRVDRLVSFRLCASGFRYPLREDPLYPLQAADP